MFLSVLLPLVLAARILIRDRFRNLMVLATGIAFYSWGEPKALPVLVGLSLFNWLVACGMARYACRRTLCGLGVTVDIVVLASCKYLPGLSLPLGLSFYVFQLVSYLVDVCRGTVPAERNFTRFLTFVSFFPKMVVGPIARYASFAEDYMNTRFDLGEFTLGLRRFGVGLAKKVLIADVMADVANTVFNAPVATVPCAYCWLGAFAYAIQIYFDFSGYTDMAIGIGRCLGFRLPENFDYPYSARSIREFWRRWHMSLSTWFRDYLYIPLGGNRRGTFRAYLNMCIVFVLCGAWHGATWTFVLWGAYHGIGLVLERAGFQRLLDRLHPVFANLYVMLFVTIGWVVFRCESLGQAATFLKQMFLGNGTHPYWTFTPFYSAFDISGILAFGAGVLLSYPIADRMSAGLGRPGRYAFAAAVFLIACLFALTGGYSPSIYGQF